MTTIIALTDLYNPSEYGRIAEGESFTVRDSLARELVRQGKASEQTYETKVLTPSFTVRTNVEVKPLPATPFRDMPAADPEPKALASLVSAVRAVSEVPVERDSRDLVGNGCVGPDSSGSEASAPSGDADDRGDAKRRRGRKPR